MASEFPFYFDTVTQKEIMDQYLKAKEECKPESPVILVAYSPDWYENPNTGVYEMEKYTYDSLARLFRPHGAFLYPVMYDDRLDGNLAEIKFDGWLIGGGRDIEPKLYGQENNGSHVYEPWSTYRWNHMRHFLDSLDKDVPIFGICYGMQVLNCLFGGTMVQHLAEKSHYRKIKMNVKPDSWVEAAIKAGGSDLSFMMGKCVHHQALDMIASDFEVVATDDKHKIAHALEYKGSGNRQIYAVQWHPEYSYTDTRWELVDGDNSSLVSYFVVQCAKYRGKRATGV
jgi:putative glutamine amidotransferase